MSPLCSHPAERDFFGGYDHRKHAGLVHVANHHISPGVVNRLGSCQAAGGQRVLRCQGCKRGQALPVARPRHTACVNKRIHADRD